jgi:hypothetical protein
MMKVHGIAIKPYEHAVPICTLRVLPCFTDRHELLPLCVFESSACLTHRWPEMAAWLDNPDAARASHLAAARQLQRDLVAGKILDDLKPFVFAELAAWHGAIDPAMGQRFLDTAQRLSGDGWLLAEIRARLTAKAAAATPKT